MRSLFVDIEALSEQQSNMALGMIYKAIGDDHTDAIWDDHPSPFVRRLVELFTQRGLMRLDGFRDELAAWLRGERHTHAGSVMPRPDGAMIRWTPEELGIVRLYLETLPPDLWTLDDHMLLVDWLAQRYLPGDDMRSEAEWLATRAGLMGKVQANAEKLNARQADAVLGALPLTVGEAARQFSLPARQRAALDFARVRAAEHVQKVSDVLRHDLRAAIINDLEQRQVAAPGAPSSSLQSKLFDRFAEANRDWRRIAITEAGEAQLQGYVASVAPGTRLRRVEQYRGACGFCAKIDGTVVEVTTADDPDKNGDTQIWPGKNNVGRSAAPRKRVGNLLVEREPDELWWIPAGLAHPNCRGRWVPVLQDEPGDDPEFGAWLRQHLEKSR